MRSRSTRLLTCALLAFQLAVGMHWPSAQAMPVPAHSMADPAQACPEHAGAQHHSESSAASLLAQRGSLQHSQAPLQSPLGQHDCCHSSGCQCHCADMPGIAQLMGANLVQTSTLLLPDSRAPAPPARPGEFFRPPIA